MRTHLIRIALPLLLALPACHLLDQSDFAPKRPAAAVVPPVPEPETRAALVTIDFATPNPNFRGALATAIPVVEARRPGVLYDVVAVVSDASKAQSGHTNAAEVMTAIEAAGVNPARIQLGLTLDPGRAIPQVRVFLR